MAGNRLIAEYRLSVGAEEVAARAEALLLEQTAELPRAALEWAALGGALLPELVSVDAVGEMVQRVRLGFPLEAVGSSAAGLLNVLFGNSSLQEDVVLEAIELPEDLAPVFGGPRFGVEGLRSIVGARGRALSCTALKPLGLGASALGGLCRTFAEAGIDVIKDDHGLGDQACCRFEDRLRACCEAIDAAAQVTGRRSVYVPSLLGGADEVRRQLDLCREASVGAVMMTPMLTGLATFEELVREAGLPVMAHPSLAGLRVAPSALLGTVFRLFGADAVIFPHYGGRFAYSEQECSRLANRLRGEPSWLRPVLPVPAGGMDADRAGELVEFYGADVMLLIGGSLYLAGEQLAQKAAGFAKAVRSAGGAAA